MFTPEQRNDLFYRSQRFVVVHTLKNRGETLRPDEQVSSEHNPQSHQWVTQHSADYRRFFDENADLVCSLIEGCNKEEECPDQIAEITRQFEQYEKMHH